MMDLLARFPSDLIEVNITFVGCLAAKSGIAFLLTFIKLRGIKVYIFFWFIVFDMILADYFLCSPKSSRRTSCNLLKSPLFNIQV